MIILFLCFLPFIFASTDSLATQNNLTPAEQKIIQAKKKLKKEPKNFIGFNELAMALAGRARESGDPAFYGQAMEAVQASFKLSPNNMEARKAEIWIHLGKHEFAIARKKALEINKEIPDDFIIYGFIVDANMELGNYKEAEEAAQWMLDMQPGNIAALTRTAYLREIFGDIDGAVELMNAAYGQTLVSETEERAWILSHLAHLHLISGKLEIADKLLKEALKLFPYYHYALVNLGKSLTTQKKYREAIGIFSQLCKQAPYPENIYLLAVTIKKNGNPEAAKQLFENFKKKSLTETHLPDNSNLELIFYYADHAQKPLESLRIAESEIKLRNDVYTMDAYAWALYVNGYYPEAEKQMEKIITIGVRDSGILYHAGEINKKGTDPFIHKKFDKITAQYNQR